MSDAREIQARMQQIEQLVQQAESADPKIRATLQELTRALLEMHGAALERLLAHIRALGDASAPLLDACAGDDLLNAVLVLHGLHPLDLETRVRRALDKVKPYLASHGGHVELISVSPDGEVQLRLDGSCHGCPSSRVTLQNTIEQEILTAAPDVSAIHVDGLVEPPQSTQSGFVPMNGVAINGSPLQPSS